MYSTQNTNTTGFAHSEARPLDMSGQPIGAARPMDMPMGSRPMDSNLMGSQESGKFDSNPNLGAQTAPGGVAWDVPAKDNTTGIVSAHPLDGAPKLAESHPSQYHHHDFNAAGGSSATSGFDRPHSLHRQEEMHADTAAELGMPKHTSIPKDSGFSMQQPQQQHQQFSHQQPMSQQPPQALSMDQLNLDQTRPQHGAIDQSRPAVAIIPQPKSESHYGVPLNQNQPLAMNQGMTQQPMMNQGMMAQQPMQQPMGMGMGMNQPHQSDMSHSPSPQMPMHTSSMHTSPMHDQKFEQHDQKKLDQKFDDKFDDKHDKKHDRKKSQEEELTKPALPHYAVGNRLFAYHELKSKSADGRIKWSQFSDDWDSQLWKKDQARESWDMIDTKKNGWMTRSDFLRFANQPGVSNCIQRMEADLPAGTGLAAAEGDILAAPQRLNSTGLDTTGELHDNSPALANAGAIYSSTVSGVDQDAKPKTASAFGDRVSQFFNKGSIGNRLFTFLDEEDNKRSGVVGWGQLMPLVTQFGKWDVNMAQHAWWKVDTKKTGTMTRGDFIKFCEQDECKGHIQLMEAELTGKADAGKFGKKIPREEFKADPSLGANTGDMQRPSSPPLSRPNLMSSSEPLDQPNLTSSERLDQSNLTSSERLTQQPSRPITGPTGLPLNNNNNNNTGFRSTDVHGNQLNNQLNQPNQIDAFRGPELARE